MKLLKIAFYALVAAFVFGAGTAQAKADVQEQYLNAVITGDVPVLEKVLAPNFWYIGSNGHIRDKEHFIEEIRNKHLVVDRLTFLNERETRIGETRLITANGAFHGKAAIPVPEGLMRYTLVLGENDGKEQVVLFQATPVMATKECPDGNCKIK